jgi:hypothetical protein
MGEKEEEGSEHTAQRMCLLGFPSTESRVLQPVAIIATAQELLA